MIDVKEVSARLIQTLVTTAETFITNQLEEMKKEAKPNNLEILEMIQQDRDLRQAVVDYLVNEESDELLQDAVLEKARDEAKEEVQQTAISTIRYWFRDSADDIAREIADDIEGSL